MQNKEDQLIQCQLMRGDDDEWLQVPSSFSLADAAEDLKSKYEATMTKPELEDPIQKNIAQFYRETMRDAKDAYCWAYLYSQSFKR